MNTSHIKKLRRLITRAELTHSTYKETPLYAVEMLIYIALYQHDHAVYCDELCAVLKLKPDKVLRGIGKHLTAYVISVKSKKEGVRGPVKAFYLTPKGQLYVDNLVEELKHAES